MISLIYFSPRLVIKDWAKIVIKVAELGGRRLEEMRVGEQYLSSAVSKILKTRGKEFLLRVTGWNQDRMHQSRDTGSF